MSPAGDVFLDDTRDAYYVDPPERKNDEDEDSHEVVSSGELEVLEL